MRQTKATIYPANSRKIISTGFSDTRQTFHDDVIERLENEPDKRFVFNDITIKAENYLDFVVERNQLLILLPIVGGLEISGSIGEITYLNVGEITVFSDFGNLKILNPYRNELVNFLEIRHESKNSKRAQTQILTYDFSKENELSTIFCDNFLKVKFSIGLFSGRMDNEYTNELSDRTFVYILSGVFEVDNKLLEKGDGLLLSDIPDFEFESLSNQAIILVIEY